LFDESDSINLLLDPERGAIIEVNRAACEYYGYSREQLERMSISEIEAAPLDGSAGTAAAPRPTPRLEPLSQHRLASGELRYVEVHSGTVRIDHRPLLYCVVRDATEQRQHGAELEAIAGSVNAGIIAFDRENNISYLSPHFTELFGYSAGDLRDWQAWSELAAADATSQRALRRVPAVDDRLDEAEVRIHTRSGVIRDTQLSMHRAHTGPVLTFTDISRQKQREASIERLSQYDVLTGLPNRALLSERLDWHLKQARRSRWFLCVAFLDLDGFKAINDRFGHGAGDQLLKVVSQRLLSTVRESDTVARLGGDEFAIAFTELATRNQILPLIERLLATIQEPVLHDGHALTVSSSIGLSFLAQDPAVDGDQLLRQADKAMYEAKLSGKNRFAVFDSDADESLQRHFEDISAIEGALRRGEFNLHYQPKVDLCSGRVIAVEALLRRERPDGEILTPDSFLPIIGDHKLSERLGAWVLDRALIDLDELLQRGFELGICINIFASQITTESFPERIAALLRKHPGVEPALVELEVVETAMLNDIDATRKVMCACRDLGVSFALDDFGTGFSSLSHLRNLPVSTVKVDRSFVDGMLRDSDDQAIVRATLGLANIFGLQTVAEGVESIEHAQALKAMGCTLAQGHAIAMPMPLDALLDWLAAWKAPPEWAALRES
jgi:diguanylate cyclase (GGDEF)-like protein/PAS domain S-box-containing protein